MKYNIAIIGGGSGGISAAKEAVKYGLSVVLIEKNKIGGDCLHNGCIPSKTFLRSAHVAHLIERSSKYGIDVDSWTPNFQFILNRIKDAIKGIEPQVNEEHLTELGVHVIRGKGTIASPNTVQVNDQLITADHIIIAAGAETFIPPIPGLENIFYLTNSNFIHLNECPKNLIILGAGVIGLEFGQAFNRLGANVTFLDRSKTLFSREDPEVGPEMVRILEREGLKFFFETSITGFSIEGKNKVAIEIDQNGRKSCILGDNIMLALGRAPLAKNLGLEHTAVTLDPRGYIKTNDHMQTDEPTIYACGDVVGPYQFAHMASYQARLIVKNIATHSKEAIEYRCVPWVTFTSPEVAHVGKTEQDAIAEGIYKKSIVTPFSRVDRSHVDNKKDGFLKLNLDHEDRIIGAAIVGKNAGEHLPLITAAIQEGRTPQYFLDILIAYPTKSEILTLAGQDWLAQKA